MQSFFAALIKCSISMSVLSLVYISITPLLKKIYSEKWCYYIWLVIIIGFMLPLKMHINIPFAQVNVPFSPTEIHTTMQNDPGITASQIVTSQASVNNPLQIPWNQLTYYMWLAGAVIVICYHIIKHYRFTACLDRLSEKPINQQVIDVFNKTRNEMSIYGHIQLKICPCIESPMLIGFRNPQLLLPETNFTDNELYFILKHEMVHYKRKDLWYKTLVLIATSIHWFNPLIYLIAQRIALQCEISCDNEVVGNCDINGRLQYSETIIGVIRNHSKIQTILSTNFYGGKSEMKNRIFSIMNMTKKKGGALLLSVVLIGIVATKITFIDNKVIAENKKHSTQSASSYSESSEQRNDTSKQYAIYSKYGLVYDKTKDSFFYKGNPVKFFIDEGDNNGQYEFFTRPKGIVALRTIRNKKKELIGITPISVEEYKKLTHPMEESVSEADDTVSRYDDADVFKAYLNYGISYDKQNNRWMFKDRPIRFFMYGKSAIYVNNKVKNGVSLKKIKKRDGKIELKEISAKEADSLIKVDGMK